MTTPQNLAITDQIISASEIIWLFCVIVAVIFILK